MDTNHVSCKNISLIILIPGLFITLNTLLLSLDRNVSDFFMCGKPDAFSESSVFTENHGAIKMKHPVLLYYNYL